MKIATESRQVNISGLVGGRWVQGTATQTVVVVTTADGATKKIPIE